MWVPASGIPNSVQYTVDYCLFPIPKSSPLGLKGHIDCSISTILQHACMSALPVPPGAAFPICWPSRKAAAAAAACSLCRFHSLASLFSSSDFLFLPIKSAPPNFPNLSPFHHVARKACGYLIFQPVGSIKRHRVCLARQWICTQISD